MEFEMIQAGWLSILPPLLAILLAFITKEVYLSLFVGVFSGTLLYSILAGETVVAAFAHLFDMAASKLADNAYMVLFLALLWGVVVIITKSGGSEAYGRWAEGRLKSKRSAGLATAFIGILIFIDDGFNCLTVGTIMSPIYDRLHISREKLSYIADSTAAPVCILAPISSWAVAVASEISTENGLSVFVSAIPYNLYAILTLIMVFFICLSGIDFGPMKRAESAAQTANQTSEASQGNAKGKVIDLVLPVAALVIFSVLGMAYVGGFFKGVPFAEAIGYYPTAGLTLGTFAALLTGALLYLPRKLMTPKAFIGHVVGGIGSIVPPMLILVLSWSLGGVCRQMLGTGEFLSGFVQSANLPFWLFPTLIFILAALMSFSMGTSWGTFGILIPIVMMICASEGGNDMLLSSLGATLAGSVFGDHCSPISDTTILSSTGAKCPHLSHVSTQLPYAITVAIICVVGYIIIGATRSPWLGLGVSTLLLIACITVLGKIKR